MILKQREGAELIVTVLGNLSRHSAMQDVGDVIDAKALLDAGHAGENLLCDYGAVRRRLLVAKTDVASRTAGGGITLAEVFDEHTVPTRDTRAIAIHVVQVLQRTRQEIRIDPRLI